MQTYIQVHILFCSAGRVRVESGPGTVKSITKEIGIHVLLVTHTPGDFYDMN